MKKVGHILLWSLFGFTVMLPGLPLVFACLGFTFQWHGLPILVSVLAALAVGTVVYSLAVRFEAEPSALRMLICIFPVLSLINVLYYAFSGCPLWTFIPALVTTGGCCFLAVKFGTTRAAKIIPPLLTFLLIYPMIFITMIISMMANFGANTVIQTLESPDGKHYAQVIDSDQGALGGDTLVNVYTTAKLNAFVFTIDKKPQQVYLGHWGEHKNMKIHWQDHRHLVINSKIYEIE